MKPGHRAWRARPRWRVDSGAVIAMGPGKADLLEAIGRTGSISSAARTMRMSYRRAWLLVETANRAFVRPLVATSRWRGRGAWLTPEGRRVVALYRRIETRSLAATRALCVELQRLLRPTSLALRPRGARRR